ncbi:MAG: hypothetical protein P8Y12_09610, partial [Gammaproteobacteria bacterium]
GIAIQSRMQGSDVLRLSRYRLRGREAFGVPVEPFDPEDLFPNRGGVLPWWRIRAVPGNVVDHRYHALFCWQDIALV